MGYTSVGKLENLGREEPWLAMQERVAKRSGELLLQRVRAHTPVAKPPPGHELEWLEARKRLPETLRNSWEIGEAELLDGGRRITIPVFTHDPVAPFVEWPTMPHIIVPRRPGGMLRFWTKLGETVYATIVHHTGTKGSFMMTTALAELALMWQDIARDEMERWAREQARLIAA